MSTAVTRAPPLAVDAEIATQRRTSGPRTGTGERKEGRKCCCAIRRVNARYDSKHILE